MFDKAVLALPGIRAALAVVCAAALARAFLVVGQAWFLATAVVALWEGGALADEALHIAGFFACFFAQKLVAVAQDAWLSRYAEKRASELRRELLETLFSKGPELVSEEGTGKLSSAVMEGVDDVEDYIKLILPKMASLLIVPLVLVVFAFAHDWVSGVIMLVAFPTIVLFMVLIGYNAQEASAKRYSEFTALSNHFVDSLRGLDTMKLFGRSRGHGETIYAVSERFREATMGTLRIATLSSGVLDLAATLSLAAVAIMLGFRMTEGAVAFFPALFVLVLTPEFFRPIREFASDYHASLDGRTALEKIEAIIQKGKAGEEEDAEGEAAPIGAPAVTTHSPAPDVATWGESSRLDLADVCFSYPAHAALEDIALSVEGCRKVGIVGASGSGKSTLANILAGFAEPASGTILLDGRPVSLHTPGWQRQVLYIPQSPYLFHASLRDNIAFYTPEASDDDVERAVSLVGLEELVAELPEGLATVVGEGARPLSGGERQRVALARALLDDSRRVLVFDEPTAHLDIETELELKERMLPVMDGRLVFFATHRLHWLADMDEVAVLEGGRLVQFGTPEELASKEGAYRRLVASMGGGA